MDNTSLLTIFLFFVAVALVINAAILAYTSKAVSKITAEFTRKAREVGPNSHLRQSVDSLLIASRQILDATEMTKQKLTELEPELRDLQGRYETLLTTVSVRIDRVATGLSEGAVRLRDVCAKPARKFGGYATNIQNAFGVARTHSEE